MASKRKHDEIRDANDDVEDLEPPLKKIHSVDVEEMNPEEKNWAQSDVCFSVIYKGGTNRKPVTLVVFAEKKTLMQSSEVFRDMFAVSLCTIDKDTGCVPIDIKSERDVEFQSWRVFLVMLHHHAMPNPTPEPTEEEEIAWETEVLMGVIVLCTRFMTWSMHALLRTRIEQVGHNWRKYPFNDRVSHPPERGTYTKKPNPDRRVIANLCTMMKLMSKWENYLIVGDQPGLWASPTAMKMLTFVFHALNRRQEFESSWDDSKDFGNFLSMMTFAHQTTCGLLTRLNLSAENTYI